MKSYLFSFRMSIILLTLLSLSSAYATFVENDFGTATARVHIYEALWFELLLAMSALQMLVFILNHKSFNLSPRFFIHISLIIILLGAGLTRYFGFEGVISIREGKSSNTVLSSQKFLHIKLDNNSFYFPYEFNAFNSKLKEKITFKNKTFLVELSHKNFKKEARVITGQLLAKISSQNITKEFILADTYHNFGKKQKEQFNDTAIEISYGSKPLILPFEIKLKDFKLERYPGSSSPSSYSSDIAIIDGEKSYATTIFMNNTVVHGGYKFFQTSYDMDELGTILTVNKDPGKIPTYIGYGLLFLTIILNFFAPNSRFFLLTQRLKKSPIAFLLLALFCLTQTPVHAQSEYIQKYLSEHATNSKELANAFGSLVVQARTGRMKPLDTLNREIIYKLSGKSTLYGMDPNQIVLGMLTRKDIWERLDILKVKSPKLKELIGVDESRNLVSFRDLFYGRGEYKIQRYVAEANRVSPAFRDTFEKDLIRLDERLNIAFMVFRGSLLKIFPQETSHNNKWVDFKTFFTSTSSEETKKVLQSAERLLDATFSRQYKKGIAYVETLKAYQEEVAAKILPSKARIEQEIAFNAQKIFPRLTPAYILLSVVIFIYAFISLFFRKLYNKYIVYTLSTMVLALFVIHTYGLGMRWYISGFAPMSNTYESIVYIAWSSMLAGIIFFRRSLFAMCAASLIAGVFMFAAHLSHIDPEITNLVPVLKSFWLTVHVSIITASYGFLGVGAILGFIALIIFIFGRTQDSHISEQLKALTDINEISLWIGLALLVIGNFLGGIWANESWGRYWGWDPKETWTFISIVVYTLVTHIRLVKSIYSPYLFNTLSLLAFSSILMTYFGVNFYLAGMHSYATGDPVPIPDWVYGLSAFVLGLILLAFPKRNIIKNHN